MAQTEDWDYWKTEARIKVNIYQNEHHLTSLKHPIRTMLEEIKPVVTEKYDFDFRHKPLKKQP